MGIEMSDRGILRHISEMEAMERAVEASRNCTQEPGKDTPTPSVGAAIIHNGKILEVAYRGELAPGDHAEFTLLEKKLPGVDLNGATLITTLEPCTIRGEGKIACANRIIERGISRVLIGILDPNPNVCGVGQLLLRRAKIQVVHFRPELVEEVETLNKNFSDQYPLEERLNSLKRAREVGPNGYKTGYDDEGNFVEFLPDEENEGEISPMILRRSDEAISAMYQEYWDMVWWNRHQYRHQKTRTKCTGRDGIGCEAAARIEKQYGRENLGWNDIDWGVLQGKLSALAWVMGSEWEGSMDT